MTQNQNLYQAHRENTGGLQGHSVGELYVAGFMLVYQHGQWHVEQINGPFSIASADTAEQALREARMLQIETKLKELPGGIFILRHRAWLQMRPITGWYADAHLARLEGIQRQIYMMANA